MKRSFVIVIILVLASMTGCLVSSLHPFFKEKDKFYDEEMAGSWIDGDECIWTIQPGTLTEGFMGSEKMDDSYRITYYEEENKPGLFTGTLFQLKGTNYVDFYPEPDKEHCVNDFMCWHHMPTHTLAKVQYNSDSILLYWFAEEWLTELFEQNRIRIKHETIEFPDYERHLLTASTDELQKFIKKYVNGPKMTEEVDKVFTRGYTDDQDGYGVFLKLKPYNGPPPGSKSKQVKPNIIRP
jgi:hypothetical protein